MNFQHATSSFFMDTDFPGTGLLFHQLYAARPEHSGMVVLRPFLHASRMGLAALHPGTCNRRTCLFFWSSPSVRHYFLCRIQLPALHAAPAEWSRPARYLSVCLTSWLAFSLTPFRDDSTHLWTDLEDQRCLLAVTWLSSFS